MTTKLITTRIAKTINPTIGFPPTTKAPKALMTWPAAADPSFPWSRIKRVDAILSERRKRVATSKSDGKTENSSVFRVYMATKRMMMANVISRVSKISRRNVGSGRIMKIRINTTPTAITMSLFFITDGSGIEFCTSIKTLNNLSVPRP
jgi:hypothetical protein